ncbi:MAG: SH3 domain-containing protein [Thermomicrobiales bacterium]|nr:SH3 domain-containing protein [Thermomicrobiales bacterium]
MDARRFDALARALTYAPSRRDVLRQLPILAGVAALGTKYASADTSGGGAQVIVTTPTPPPVGGSSTGGTTSTTGTGGGVSVCLPIAKTGTDDGALPPYYAEIIEGACDSAASSTLFELLDVSDADGVVGVPPAALVARSVTTVRAPLDDLVGQRHSIAIRVSAEDPTMVACGEIGGIRDGDELAVGLRERNNSGFSGISVIRGADESSLVYLYLGRGLSTISTAPAAVNSTVIATADINLRAQPAADSEILTVIGTGTELTVTGAAVGDWIPVDDPFSGLSGYVSAQFVEVPQ